ncbi:putative ATP-binding protein [Escherichia coli]|uniref:Putative ATP-binding protein n=1 Tax=Escherichia coli TaxID=562 RepID=A0A2X1J9K7_ECOLX|nr:putative ATP-binding protein [Escherichia coli]
MKRLKNELNALVNRGVDRHLRLAVTGLSRSGKTAFITAMVNQLLNIHAGARLPLVSAVREERPAGRETHSPSVTLAFRASPMTKGWRSYMAIHPPGQRQRAASVKSAWR